LPRFNIASMMALVVIAALDCGMGVDDAKAGCWSRTQAVCAALAGDDRLSKRRAPGPNARQLRMRE